MDPGSSDPVLFFVSCLAPNVQPASRPLQRGILRTEYYVRNTGQYLWMNSSTVVHNVEGFEALFIQSLLYCRYGVIRGGSLVYLPQSSVAFPAYETKRLSTVWYAGKGQAARPRRAR